jgi:hypothetical protein
MRNQDVKSTNHLTFTEKSREDHGKKIIRACISQVIKTGAVGILLISFVAVIACLCIFCKRAAFQTNLTFISNYLQWRFFQRSGSDKVLIGKHGRLFSLENGEKETIMHELLGEEKVGLWARHFEARRRWLKLHKIRYVLVFVPSKSEIYPDDVPRSYRPIQRFSIKDQILQALKETTLVEYFDLRNTLLPYKLPPYDKTDSRLNQAGAFFSGRALTTWLEDKFPDVKPLQLADIETQVETQPGGDLAAMLGLADQMPENVVRVRLKKQRWSFCAHPAKAGLGEGAKSSSSFATDFATETRDSKSPVVYVLGDSCGIEMQPFLSQTLRRVFYHWDYLKTSDHFSVNEILLERPDIVIEEKSETSLARPMIPNPMAVEHTMEYLSEASP